jgi:2-aminomuconate deaminase
VNTRCEGVLPGKAKPRGNYSHVKRAGPFLFTAGISSRRTDNSIAGASVDELGTMRLDIREQTRVVLSSWVCPGSTR